MITYQIVVVKLPLSHTIQTTPWLGPQRIISLDWETVNPKAFESAI